MAVKERVASFFSALSEFLDDGLNCIHFHKVKLEELCILLRGYHTPEELYVLLHSVVGNNNNFRDFIFQHYRDVCDVRGFAALANMSVRSFQRKFKAEFKRPVHEWLNERRAELILHEIRNTDKCIAEIGTAYGFATPSYFTTFCKQYFGQTPTQLRRCPDPLPSEFWGGYLAVGEIATEDRSRGLGECISDFR